MAGPEMPVPDEPALAAALWAVDPLLAAGGSYLTWEEAG